MKPIRPITAAEGAERVAARARSRRTHARSDDDHNRYTCENCGGHEFEVRCYFDHVKFVTESLDCVCGTEREFAARRVRMVTRAHTWTGALGTDHRLAWIEREHETEEIVDMEIQCQDCTDDADNDIWDLESDSEFEPTGEDEHWEVRCATCEHEIEFGWSHPSPNLAMRVK